LRILKLALRAFHALLLPGGSATGTRQAVSRRRSVL
jgi:hypothetical protein